MLSYSALTQIGRFPIACQMIFSLAVLCCCPFICETPRWLAQHGHTEKAQHVIARLLDKPDDDLEVKGQLNEILETLAIENEDGEVTWSEVFSNVTKPRNLQRVLLGMGPYMMNQWSGINVSGGDYLSHLKPRLMNVLAGSHSATTWHTFSRSILASLAPCRSSSPRSPSRNTPSSHGHHTGTWIGSVVDGPSSSPAPDVPSAWPSSPAPF